MSFLINSYIIADSLGGLGVFYENYNNSPYDIYVTTGYPISAVFDKNPGFGREALKNFISALDHWGLILSGSNFNTQIMPNDLYAGGQFITNPLSGQSCNSIVISLSANYNVGGSLGYAGVFLSRRDAPSLNTTQFDIPYQSYMVFNDYYTPSYLALKTPSGKNSFYNTILHEIGHALGLGFWHDYFNSSGTDYLIKSFIVGAGDNTPNPLNLGLSANFFYTLQTNNASRIQTDIGRPTKIGPVSYIIGDAQYAFAWNGYSTVSNTSKAVSAYNDAFGLSLTSIPVENGVSFGSIGSHWDEGYNTSAAYGSDNRNYYGSATPGAPGLNDELMSPQSEGVFDMPLSKITLGAVEDLGYTVNYNLADTFLPTVFNVYENGSSNPFDIGFNGSTYRTSGSYQKPLILKRGSTYTFNLFAGASHPIYIVSTQGDTGSPPTSRITNGVVNDGVGTGTMTWTVPINQTTGNYYLQCGSHSSMTSKIIVF
jgi:hypothetical protein